MMIPCHGPEKISRARIREVEEWGERLTVFSSAADGDDVLASSEADALLLTCLLGLSGSLSELSDETALRQHLALNTSK